MDPVYKDVPKAMFLLMIVLVKYWFICTNIFISINIHGSWFHNTLKDIHFTRNLCDKCFASIFILHCIQLYYTNCDHFCILVHNDENIYLMFFFQYVPMENIFWIENVWLVRVTVRIIHSATNRPENVILDVVTIGLEISVQVFLILLTKWIGIGQSS